MKTANRSVFALRAILLGVLAGAGAAPALAQFVPHQAVVRVHAYSTIEQFLELWSAQTPGVTILKSIDSRRIYLLELPPGKSELQAEIELRSYVNPNANIVDPARPLQLADLNEGHEASEGSTGTIWFNQLPTGNLFAEQFAVEQLGMAAAHQTSIGTGVIVAIVDTGVDAAHPLLSGAVENTGWNFLTNTADVADVGNGVDDDGDTLIDEMVGHGTFIASLVLLTAPGARILPIVAIDSERGGGDAFVITQAIYHALDHGADVINLSLGSFDKSDLIEEAIHDARAAGVMLVAAAGNYADDTDVYPAATNDVLGVAAVDDADIKAPFSSYNKDLALSAPGYSHSLAPGQADPARAVFGALAIPGELMAAWDGTSFAAAFVSGGAALLKSMHPHFAATEGAVEALEDLLMDTAVGIDDLNPQYEEELGAGRLDLAAAVSRAGCAGADINENGRVDLGDLGTVLAQWGQTPGSPDQFLAGDINYDRLVNLSDLGTLLSKYNEVCP